MNIEATAVMVVNAIIDDLADRRGLRQSWEEIDPDTQREIQAKWTALVIQWFKPV